MQKSVIGVIIAVVAVAALGGIVLSNNKQSDKTSGMDTSHTEPRNGDSNKQQSSQPEEQTAPNSVSIVDFAFSPKKMVVKKGTTVTWTNKDSARHDINPDEDYGDAFKPSELLAKGDKYSFTFDTVGTYAYHCSPHPYMKATIEVTE